MFRISSLLVCILIPLVASAASFCPNNPVTIDGSFGCHEWDTAQTVDLEVNVPEGGTAPARLYFMNDDKLLYVGLRILRVQNWYTGMSVTLDANRDRILSAGDDLMGVRHDPRYTDEPMDGVYFTGGICPIGALCSGDDVNFGGALSVVAAVGTDGKYTMYEFSKPLVTFDGVDAMMPIGSSIGTVFALQLLGEDGKSALTYYPAVPSAGQWVDYVIRDCRYWY